MAAAVELPRPAPKLQGGGHWPTWPAFLEPVAQGEPQGAEKLETNRLLASAQAEADGLFRQIRRLAPQQAGAVASPASRTQRSALTMLELDQAQEIYQTVEKELVRLQRQQQELLQRSQLERGLRGEAERAQQAAIREQREVLRGVQQRLEAVSNLEEQHGKAREEAEEARDAAEASLGRLGIELVRLQSREAILLEECAARRSSEAERAKQSQELRFLRQSAATEKQRHEEVEAVGRERLEEMRREVTKTRSEVEELREEQRSGEQKWRKLRALERENRQLREKQLQLQSAEGDLRSLRGELQDALAKGEEDQGTAEQLKQSHSKVKQQLLKEQAEVHRLRGALQHSEDQVMRLQQDVQDAAAAREKEKILEKQHVMNENRIHELCASLIKAESRAEHLQIGCAALPEAQREAHNKTEELVRLQHEETAIRLRLEAQQQETMELNRRMAEIHGELHKERGRNEQLKRQLRGVSDERDEVVAQDWKRLEQVREEKDCKERLLQECERFRLVIHETRQEALAEMQAQEREHHAEFKKFQEHLHQQKEVADNDHQRIRSEMQQQHTQHLGLKQQELDEQRTAQESVEAEMQQLRSDLSSYKAQAATAANSAAAAALSQRNQRILHKQQLDNLTEEHQAQLHALNQQHMQQLTVQQHMLDPERLSTFVDDLLDEISCLRQRTEDKPQAQQELLLPLSSPHLEVSSRRLAKMRQRLAERKEETPSRSRPTGCLRMAPERSGDSPRTPSPERLTQRPLGSTEVVRLPYTLEPVTTQEPSQCQEPRSPEASEHAKHAKAMQPEVREPRVAPRRLQAEVKKVKFES